MSKKRKASFGADRAALKDLQARLQAEDQQTLGAFEHDRKLIDDWKLPVVAKQRYEAALAKFQKESSDIQSQLVALSGAHDKELPALAAQLEARLDSLNPKNRKAFDPKAMPFRVAESKVRKPKTTPQEIQDLLTQYKAPAARLPVKERMEIISASELAAIEDAAEHGDLAANVTYTPEVASIGPMAGILSMAAFMPPAAMDLLATDDVQITPEIQALAAQLGNNPVQINNWVHDNVTFISSYGAVQGSDETLQNLKGNAFDISCLLVALLRASNIPARFVYGTVQMPIAQAANWLGVPNQPMVALDLLSQGGIPNTALVQGGQVVAVQIEHIWVEAWVDQASRGNKNNPSLPHVWNALDVSFKQYSYKQGLNLTQAVPVDGQSLLSQGESGSTIDNSNSSATSVNQGNTLSQLNALSSQMQNYIASNAPQNAAVGDVFGGRSIVPTKADVLPSSVPFKIIARGASMTGLSDSFRYKATVEVFNSESDQASDNPVLTYTIGLPALGARRLGLTYLPASDSDAQTIQQAKKNGSSSLPAYMINLVPQLQLDGQVIATGGAIGMASAQFFSVRLTDPQNLNSATVPFSGFAGDEVNFGITGGVISPNLVQIRANATSPSDGNAAENLFQLGLIFWLEHEIFDQIEANLNGVFRMRLPSVGLFSAPISPKFYYGVPQSADYSTRQLDVKRNLQAVVAPSQQATATYLQESGIYGSLLESSVPEQVFHRSPNTAVSTTPLLAEASNQGVPIYFINSSNFSAIAPHLQLSAGVMDDISNAIAAGQVVIAPQHDITLGSYTGAGYIVRDPITGAGAYLVENGSNGAVLAECAHELVPAAGAVFAAVVLAVLAAMSIELLAAGATAAMTLIAASVIAESAITTVAIAQTALAVVVVGFLMTAYSNVKALGSAAARSVANFDECSCNQHLTNCYGSNLGGSANGSSVCLACYDWCRGSGTGTWPDEVIVGSTGSMPIYASCAYW